jgi:hypothetical protein
VILIPPANHTSQIKKHHHLKWVQREENWQKLCCFWRMEPYKSLKNIWSFYQKTFSKSWLKFKIICNEFFGPFLINSIQFLTAVARFSFHILFYNHMIKSLKKAFNEIESQVQCARCNRCKSCISAKRV